MSEPAKRAYDGTRRRARAEEERAETRRRVVAAARRLFLEKGYVATTMSDIRQEAGVAMQSVYNAGQSKAELLFRVVDLAVGGDDQDVLVEQRAAVLAVKDEAEPARQLAMITDLIAEIIVRVAPVWVPYRQAAAVDAAAAVEIEADYRRRRLTMGNVLRFVPEDRLSTSYDEAADILWAISSVDVYLLLTGIQGWSHDRWAAWLADTVALQLLAPTPAATPSRRSPARPEPTTKARSPR